MEKFRVTQDNAIYVLLLVFVVLSSLYAIAVPPFEASDELWHYPMVKYIADHWALPVQDHENIGPWRQEGSQPPLYYFIAAAATFWIDTSDIETVRHLNPHVDNGVATADGNINLITHHPTAEAFPWRGTTLAVRLIRLLSVLMGAAAVYLTYRLALALLPDRPTLALGAAAIHAFTPMFVFISGAVNNDNLVIPLCTLALWLMVRLVTHALPQRFGSQALWFMSLGIVVGMALLTKESAGGLVLLTALTVGYVAWRQHASAGGKAGWRTFLTGSVATGAPTLLIAGWWYLRNWQLYGDPTGQNVFIEILGQRDVPANLAQLWRERVSFVRGYWGNFGGLNVPMAEWVYVALDIIALLSVLGLALILLTWLLRLAKGRRTSHTGARGRAAPGGGPLAPARPWHCPPGQVSAGECQGADVCQGGQVRVSIAWLITLSWPLLVVVLWITWATNTWSSQGRLIFSAISVWSLLLALGWERLIRLFLAVRLAGSVTVRTRQIRTLGAWLFAALPLFLFVISLIAPWAWIRPAYARPPVLTDEQVAAIPQRVDVTFFHPARGQLKLLGYKAPVTAAYPGESVPITLYWEALEAFGRDYSAFVHLIDAQNLIAAQRDAYPGMGMYSTQWLEPGQRWAEERILTLPETAFSPNQVSIALGLYDYQTGERLTAVDATGQIVGDQARLSPVEVLAREGDWPNPISIDLGGEMRLLGYDLDRRALRPGETSTLTLYWRAQRPMAHNYSISTQLVNEYGVKAAQKDAWPFDGARPTSTWAPGELIAEPRALTIFDDAPPGVYDVYIAVYPSDDPGALLVVTPSGGRLQTDHVVLTTVCVLPR